MSTPEIPAELSEACFFDRDRDCTWAGCTCKCHRDQFFDWGSGWRDKDDFGPDDNSRWP